MRMNQSLLVLALLCFVALVSGAAPAAPASTDLAGSYYSSKVVGGATILIEDGSDTALAEEAAQTMAEHQAESATAEDIEALQDRVAHAEADAEAHALFESDEEMQQAADKEMDSFNTPQESLIEKEALANTNDVELHVTSEADFEDATALLEGTADDRVEAELSSQLAAFDAHEQVKSQQEEQEMEALIEEAEGGAPGSEIEHEILAELNQEAHSDAETENELKAEVEGHSEAEAEAEVEAEAQTEAEDPQMFSNMENYDTAMIESASTARSTAGAETAELPESVTNAMAAASNKLHSAMQAAKGMMGKLKHKIMHAVHGSTKAKEEAVRASTRPHSLISSKSKVHHQVKGGDQWWLEKAPWFLPPPPEWGPMPVTMYTSYYHKPTHPHHLDYAHGIPLPHAEALNMARRTYPQPPFEAQAEASFMEVNEEAHHVDNNEAEETEFIEPELIEMSSEGETHTEATTEAAADASTEAAVDHNPHFFLDDSADKVGLKGEAVEAAEVDNLTQSSPASTGEEILSVSM